MLMFAVLISGANLVNKTAPQKVEAVETKCYGFCEDGDFVYSTKKRVKIGKYYYRINDKNGNLQRSKSKNKNFKTILKDATDCLIYGKLIYFAQLSGKEGKEEYTIYTCNLNGKSKKKIFTTQEQASSLSLSTIYKNKLYLSIYAESSTKGNCQTYSISLKGKAKLKKVKNKLCLFNQRYGHYILGAHWFPSDVSDHGVCIYDVKKNKIIHLASNGEACFAGKKVYYSSYSAKAKRYYIKRCNPDGSNKEVVAKLDKKVLLVTKVTKTYCEAVTMYTNDGKEKREVIKY